MERNLPLARGYLAQHARGYLIGARMHYPVVAAIGTDSRHWPIYGVQRTQRQRRRYQALIELGLAQPIVEVLPAIFTLGQACLNALVIRPFHCVKPSINCSPIYSVYAGGIA